MKRNVTRFFWRGWTWARNQDLVVLLSGLVLVAGIWGFIELADEVQEGETRRIDESVLRFFRNPADLSDPIGPHYVEEAVRDFTALGSVAVLALFSAGVAGFLVASRKFHALALLLSALIGGLLLNSGLKALFARARPDLVPHLHQVSTQSFPSGHSLLAAVVYLTLGALLSRLIESRRLKIYIVCCALLITFLVGLSRVYLGVHYPTDVLAGWTIGLLWAILCWLVARHLQRRGKVEKPEEPAPSG